MNQKKSLGILVCLWMSVLLHAQSTLRFERFSTLDGLGNNAIFDAATDKKGNLWLATYDGLSCYNGLSFKNFKPDVSNPGFAGSNIIKLIEPDSSGNIWFGTAGTGFSVLHSESGTFKNYPIQKAIQSNGTENNDIRSICHLSATVWMAAPKNLYVFTKKTESIIEIDREQWGLKGELVGIQALKNNRICIASSKELLFLNANDPYRIERLIPKEQLGFTEDIRNLEKDANGNLLLLSSQSLKSFVAPSKGDCITTFELSSRQVKQALGLSASFRKVTCISDQEYWIALDKGILIFNKGKERPFHLVTEKASYAESLSGNNITGICKDREDNVWISTRYSGLCKLNRCNQAFQKFSRQSDLGTGMTSNDVRALLKEENGNIWIGYRGRGIDLYEKKTGRIIHFHTEAKQGKALPSNVIREIYKDRKGQIWIGSSRGVSKISIHKGHYQVKTISQLCDEDLGLVYKFYEDAKNRFWIGSNRALFLYDEEKQEAKIFKQERRDDLLGRANSIRCMAEDAEGNLWLASDGGGIHVIHPIRGFLRSYSTFSSGKQTISHNKIYSLLWDSKNRLWAGTHNGLNLLQDPSGEFKTYTHINGLINDVVYGVQEDQEGNLWISTSYGLSKFNPENESFQNYLQGFEFSDDAWSKGPEGEILVGGLNGFFTFHPKKIHPNETAPLVWINEFQLQNKKLQVNEEHNGRIILKEALSEIQKIELEHDENFFSFDLLAISLTHPQQVKYQYQLLGFNDNWIDLDAKSRTAYFTNVPHGTYRFQFKASNGDGVWSQEKFVELIIHPVFYQTLWFRLLFVLFLLFLIFLIYYLRLQTLTRQKQRLEKEVDEKTSALRLQNHAIEKQNRKLEFQKNEIEEQRDKVLEMTRMIHETDERKIKFFTNISHEIRTPLTLITGPVEKLLETMKKEEQHYPTIQLVERNANRLLKLVNQLLDFRKMDTGHMPIHLQKKNLSLLVEQLFVDFKPLAAKKHLSFCFHQNPANYQLFFDVDVVEKILTNLLSNAIKYTQLEGEVHLRLKREREQILIEVQDNGPGILPGVRKSVFQRFYRVEEKNMDSRQGTGIGLALSKEMAILHGGDISIVDAEERGSCFRLELPVFEEGETEVLAQLDNNDLHLPQAELLRPEANFTVLIVEDNVDLRSFIKESLNGNEILEAENGEEGIQMALEKLPDLIISDVLMPGKNGFELCKYLKEDSRTNHIPILLLTALGAEEHQQTGIDLGADDYIVKPFNHRILCGKVNNILRKQENLKEKLQENLSNPEPQEVYWKDALPPFVLPVVDHIERHLQDKSFGVEELSKLMGMSHSTLYRKMKAITNQSTIEFIREVKMRNALDLLQEDQDLQISEVAYLVGFEDVNYFRQCFKKQFGKTPSELTR